MMRRRTRTHGLAGLGLLAAGSLLLSDPSPFAADPDVPALRRRLRSGSHTADAILAAHGPGPRLAGLDGRVSRLDGAARWKERGATWYAALSTLPPPHSPSSTTVPSTAGPNQRHGVGFQWTLAPYQWEGCPPGQNMYLGATAVSFVEPHPLHPHDPSQSRAKYLRFRLGRKDRRKCLFNDSAPCLAGGNFAMNFGKRARDVLQPGEYTLKTNEGVIRVVAFNTRWECLRKWQDSNDASGQTQGGATDADVLRNGKGAQDVIENSPIDHLRRGIARTNDPQACQAWINQRQAKEDIYTYESDHAVVYVDAPWVQFVVEVDQNKVATDASCEYAGMNVYVTEMDEDLLRGGYGGLFGGISMTEVGMDAGLAELERGMGPVSRTARALRRRDGEEYVVDGPFPNDGEGIVDEKKSGNAVAPP